MMTRWVNGWLPITVAFLSMQNGVGLYSCVLHVCSMRVHVLCMHACVCVCVCARICVLACLASCSMYNMHPGLGVAYGCVARVLIHVHVCVCARLHVLLPAACTLLFGLQEGVLHVCDVCRRKCTSILNPIPPSCMFIFPHLCRWSTVRPSVSTC